MSAADTPREPADHPGSRGCYSRGCREPQCREANRLYTARHRHGAARAVAPQAAASGGGRRLTDANGKLWLDMLDAAEAASPAAAYMAALAGHRAARACIAPGCDSVGGCRRHGAPAEDDGSWLWAGVA